MRPQSPESFHTSEPLDIREVGAPTPDGNPQISSRRLFLQLHAFAGTSQPKALIEALSASSVESVLYHDLNDPTGVGVLLIATDPNDLVFEGRKIFHSQAFSELRSKPELTMIGRTYSTGREPDLEDWLLVKPRRNVLDPANCAGQSGTRCAANRSSTCFRRPTKGKILGGARHDGARLCRSRICQRHPFGLLRSGST